LIQLLCEGSHEAQANAAGVLTFLAQKSAESQNLIRELGAVDMFIKLYSLGSEEGRANAARYLMFEPDFMRVMREEQDKEVQDGSQAFRA